MTGYAYVGIFGMLLYQIMEDTIELRRDMNRLLSKLGIIRCRGYNAIWSKMKPFMLKLEDGSYL